MPDRIISERIRRSESLDRLSPEAERLFWRMVTVADDHGRLDGRPEVVRADCFKRQDVTDGDVAIWLEDVESAGIIVRYMARRQVVIELVNWQKHQKIAEPNPSAFPSREEAAKLNGSRVYGVPRVRAPAHTRTDTPPSLTGISGVPIRTTPDIPGVSPVGTGDGIHLQKGKRVGGAGGRIPDVVPKEVRQRPEPPDILLAFDEVLRTHPDYWPTVKFFERVVASFVGIPGLDLEYEAEGMIAWLGLHPGKRSDIPRFAERWLTRAKGDAERARRQGRPYGKATNGSGERWRMGGTLSAEALASADRMDERGRSHYAD